MTQPLEIVSKIALDNWRGQIAATDKVFNRLSDEELMSEVAPGRNRAVYLQGHLTAVHDRMMPLLGFGAQKYEHLNESFLTSPDKADSNIPSLSELRTAWSDVNQRLDKHLSELKPEEWMDKHTSVSEEDFAKEPHRNRLNVIFSRATHLSNHQGQLLLIKGGGK